MTATAISDPMGIPPTVVAPPHTTNQNATSPYFPSEKLFLDFCGSGESADICSPLIAQLRIEDLPQRMTSANIPIPELGSYQDQVSQCGPIHANRLSNFHGKCARNKYRVGRLEGLKMAQIWCQEYKGRLLRKAVQMEDIGTVRELLDEGVHVDNCDEKQRTALHLASVKGNSAIVELLLSRGANPNCRDVNQNTPLMLASMSRKIPIITLLLKNGANPRQSDSKGNNALTIAQNRLTHLQQCQVACEYLRGELMHIIAMIREFIRKSELIQPASQTTTGSSDSACISNNSSGGGVSTTEDIQIEAMISKLSFRDQDPNFTRQVADEFQELLQKFSTQVKLS